MASYHFSAQIITRKGNKNGERSAVACAAYRAGDRLKDDRINRTFNYSQRKGVSYAGILLPEGADKRLANRSELWNEVEFKEKRKDAQLAREINIALPHELTQEERKELLLAYVQEQFVDKGMVADIAIHEPMKEHGDHRHNHHAHIMLTLRQAQKYGFRRTKTREWNSRDQMKEWRKTWEEHQNRALERGGHDARVDHRTLAEQQKAALEQGNIAKAQELDRTPEIHVGVRARKIEQKRREPHNKDSTAKIFARGYDSITKQAVMHVRKQVRQEHHNQKTLKNIVYHQKMRSVDRKLGVLHIFDGRQFRPDGQTWTREYSQFLDSRAKFNGNIIKQNQKKYEKRILKLETRQIRFKQRQLYYMAQGNKPHAKRRLGLLGTLLNDVGRALMQAMGVHDRRSNRYLDYNGRFLAPVLNRRKEVTRGRGGGRERLLH